MGLWKLRSLIFTAVCLAVIPLAAAGDVSAPDHGAGESTPSGSAPVELTGLLGETETLAQAIEGRVADDTDSVHLSLVIRLGIAAAIIIGQILFIKLVWFLFARLNKKVAMYGVEYIRPLKIKKYLLLETKQILGGIYFLLKIVKYVVTFFLFFLTIPVVFSLFPLTKNLANTLFGYIINPLKNIAMGIIGYIPNLFTIVIIIFITRYVMRSLKFLTSQIEKGKLVIPGFYTDWAQPTFNILRVLLYAFTVAVVYPYLPGSDSAVFQGVSVFVGVIFSLGSSSAIGNLVAGVVITYMRPFKIGDRIKLNDVTGFVVEKSPIVTRVRTHKNEYVTFPNTTVLNSSIINYNTSSEENAEGLILYATITMGYQVPWPKVHEILINAALKTPNVEKQPKPFVLQTALDDFYCEYQINVYTKAVDLVPSIYSELYQNIQDGFTSEGIDMTTPHYEVFQDARDKSGT